VLLARLECAGPITRAALAEASGLPRTTVAGLTAGLLARGLVVEHEPVAAGVGRPPTLLSVAGPARLIGVVSGDAATTTASLLNFSGELEARSVGPGDTSETSAVAGRAADLLTGALDLLTRTLRQAGAANDRLAAVVVDVQRHVGTAESAGRTVTIADVEVPVLPENDANLGALGEAVFGAGRGLDSLIYVKLGRNVGAGLVLGGRLVRGAAGFAGELAHVQTRGETGEGAVCVCGGRGCLATLVGPSLVEFVQRAYSERMALSEVLALAAERDPGVSRVFSDLGRIIGRPLADLCTMIDPAAVIVDSTISSAGELVLAGISESIARHAAPVVADSVRVLAGELGEEAEVLGAVALARLETLRQARPAQR
jgi:predicted NBD/HSP70 family sugar kinase